MEKLDRLVALARRQLYAPLCDFAFVGAMVAMTALSLAALGGAANQASSFADPTANDNRPTLTTRACEVEPGLTSDTS